MSRLIATAVGAAAQAGIALAWILAALTACLVAWLALDAIYSLTLHPLARIPGPRPAAVSNVWLALQARNGRLVELGLSLHERYGSAVRVGPNEVWFNSREAFKTIYSAGSGFEKSDFYLATCLQRPRIDYMLRAHPADTLDLLSERDMRRYRLQRRLVGPVYRPDSVARHAEAVDRVMGLVVSRLRALGGGGGDGGGVRLDLEEWMHVIAVECLGAAVLSWSPGLLRQGGDGGAGAHGYLAWRRKTVLGLFPAVVRLDMCWGSLGRAFGRLWGITFAAPPRFRPFFPSVGRRIGSRLKMAQKARKDPGTAKATMAAGSDLAADLIRLHHDRPEFTEVYLRRMIMTNFGAGHETLASTLTSIVALVATHPAVQERLAAELAGGGAQQQQEEGHGISDTDNDDTPPYLAAVIQEAKRLRPVLGTAPPRRVPAGGVTIDDHLLPGGTVVGCHPFALHRNEAICGRDPHRFDPDRWMDGADLPRARIGAIRDMEAFSLAWGGGARTCPGRHLASVMVTRIVSALFRHFEVSASVPDEADMPSYFLSMMTGVKASFRPLGDGPRADDGVR